MERRLISGHSPFEPIVGFSRAVVADGHVYVAGTAPIPADGSPPPDGAYEQAPPVPRIIGGALESAGVGFEQVVRTRVYVTDRGTCDAVGRAHGEVFSEIRPASTMVVTKLLDPAWKVEIDADAVLG